MPIGLQPGPATPLADGNGARDVDPDYRDEDDDDGYSDYSHASSEPEDDDALPSPVYEPTERLVRHNQYIRRTRPDTVEHDPGADAAFGPESSSEELSLIHI